MNSGRFKSLRALGIELSPPHAGRNQNCPGMEHCAAIQMQACGPCPAWSLGSILLDGHRRHHLRSEFQHLQTRFA